MRSARNCSPALERPPIAESDRVVSRECHIDPPKPAEIEAARTRGERVDIQPKR
jgi:hypothetical protein